MMQDDFYATIKFKSGEEIFALVGYTEEEDRTFLLLESPITIEKIRNRAERVKKLEFNKSKLIDQ